MKAKFNQILANFDNENKHNQEGVKQFANGNSNTTQSTGYFKGGVPQELHALPVSSVRNEIPIGSSSNELTMKGINSAIDHNTTDAIESIKKRNIERNMGQVTLKPFVKKEREVGPAIKGPK